VRKNTDKALLGFGLMWREDEFLLPVEKELKEIFSDFVISSDVFEPPFSSYYFREFGSPLKKKFVITHSLINKPDIVGIKHKTVSLEDKYRIDGKRTVNIDPFYIDLDQVIVSTNKFRGNRIYAGEGVFLELELFYHHGSFQPFIWTYRDYQEQIPFFNRVKSKIRDYFV